MSAGGSDDYGDLGMTGAASWGPLAGPVRIAPPPMTWPERVLLYIGLAIEWTGERIAWLGFILRDRATERVNTAARRALAEHFGAPPRLPYLVDVDQPDGVTIVHTRPGIAPPTITHHERTDP